MTERLISSDSHVKVTQDQVKARLDAKYHGDYDAAVAEFENRVMGKGSGAANRAGMVSKSMTTNYTHPAHGRPGNADPYERLKDMDTDGVDSEVCYCDVSAFRYLYLVKNGWQEATRAFNDCLNDFGSVDPKRLVVSYQIPIHDIGFAASEVRRGAHARGGVGRVAGGCPQRAPPHLFSLVDPGDGGGHQRNTPPT